MMGTEPWEDPIQGPDGLRVFRLSEERCIALPSKESRRFQMIHPQKIHFVEESTPYVSLCGLKDSRFVRVTDSRHMKCKSCEKAFSARYGRKVE